MHHQHPLKILKYSAKNLWLLIFPLIRGLMAIKLDINEFYVWIKGAWFDILIIAAILLIGYIRWLFSYYFIQNEKLIFHNGIFARTVTSIPYKNITSASFEYGLIQRIFKAVTVAVNTSGGVLANDDVKIMVKQSDITDFEERIAISRTRKGTRYKYKPDWVIMLFFSFLFSSSFSGALYIATIFFESGKIAESIIQKRVTEVIGDAANEVGKYLFIRVPPIAIAIGLLVILSWLISFIRNLFKYSGFSIDKNRTIIKIAMGLITKYQYYIMNDKVNYIDVYQNLMMKIFKVMSVNIGCSGYGNKKDSLPVYVPIMKKSEFAKTLKIFTDTKANEKLQFRAAKRTFFRYCWKPFYLAIGLFIAAKIMQHFFPQAAYIIDFILLMTEIPVLWYLVIKLVSVFTTGFGIDNNNLYICSCRGFHFHSVYVKTDRIAKVIIMQNFFQKFMKMCDVTFYVHSETPKKYKVKSVQMKEAEAFLSASNLI